MTLYGGIDLHSTNSYLVLLDEHEKIIYSKRLPNDLAMIINVLSEYNEIDSIVIESTYNWYWLVDGLMAAGYKVKLANPNAIQQYNGIKQTNDKTDARWLAQLNLLNLLKTGYIYPKENRGLRDLLRKRMQLVQDRTLHMLALQTIVERSVNIRLTSNTIKKLEHETLQQYFDDDNIYFAASTNLTIMQSLETEIRKIEIIIKKQAHPNRLYKLLQTAPGIGETLALTILLETGDIGRFKQVGNYASYCRCVNSKRESNGKKKGENNRKNGNKYLSWAFVEAANFAIRYDETIRKYYQRRLTKNHRVVAIKTIAHKMARACFFVMRDEIEFDVALSFSSQKQKVLVDCV